jgi:hypothetical protein
MHLLDKGLKVEKAKTVRVHNIHADVQIHQFLTSGKEPCCIFKVCLYVFFSALMNPTATKTRKYYSKL